MAAYGIHGAVENYTDLPDAVKLDLGVVILVRRDEDAPEGAGLYWVQKNTAGKVWKYLDALSMQNALEIPYDNNTSGIAGNNVQDAIDEIASSSGGGSGDMAKAVYDQNDNGIVDKAESIDDGTGTAISAIQLNSAYEHSQTTNSNPHAVTASETGAITVAEKGMPDGIATLDSGGKIPASQVPAILLHNQGYFATEAALATAHPSADSGDYAIIGSTDTVWVWDADTLAWMDSSTSGSVASVNGQTGEVIIDYSDVGAASAAQGVTGGDSHAHTGSDGAQLNHSNLIGAGSNTHNQIDTHIAGTGNSVHGLGSMATQSVDDYFAKSASDISLNNLTTQVRQMQTDFVIPGTFMSGRSVGDDLLETVVKHVFKWELPTAKLRICKAVILSGDSDSSINVEIGGVEVLSSALALSTAESSGVINTTGDTVNTGDRVEITVLSTGANSNAKDLTVRMLWEVTG